MITDSQIHVWEDDRPDRPWPKPLRNQPQLPNGFTADKAIAAMNATGIDRAIIVPPTWIGDQNDTAIEAAQAYPGRFGIMGRFDPIAPGWEDKLKTWRDQPYMLGIRMTFRVQPFAAWLEDDTLNDFWAACERLGIPVMVLVPGVVRKITPVAERYPNLNLIIDHMGIDLTAKGEEATNVDDLIAIAKHPNVSVKTSSAPCFSKDPYPYPDIYKMLSSIYNAFSSHRMLWGADLTRLTSTYEECLRHFQQGLDFLTADDKDWCLGKSAATILNWPEA